MMLEHAKQIIKEEQLRDGFLYTEFFHIQCYEGIVIEKVEEQYRVCRRMTDERNGVDDYDVKVFDREGDALDYFIERLRVLEQQNRRMDELRELKERKKRKEQIISRITYSIFGLTILLLVLIYIIMK